MTASNTTGGVVVRSAVALVARIAIVAGLAVNLVASAQDTRLRIVVVEGEDGVNIIGRGTAVPTVVEVRDRNDLPVSGASVLFLLGEGGTATLNAGLSQVAVTTNALGQAAVTVNPLASGAVQLQVSAAFQGQTATAAIVQTNVATAATAGGAAGGAAGTAGAGGGTGGGAGGATGAAAGGGAGGGLGAGGIVGIVAGSVGAAVAGAAVARDAAPAPPVAVLRIAPNGLGMAGLTEYRFDGRGSSDPNPDALTYAWDFGDGSRGMGVTATHIYAAAGTYNVTLTVSDGSVEGTTEGRVRVGPDLGARFVAMHSALQDEYPSCGYFHVTQVLDLQQARQSVRGVFDHSNTTDTDDCDPYHVVHSVRGEIASVNNFVCPCDIRLEFRLTYASSPPDDPDDELDGDSWTGTVTRGAESIELPSGVFRRQ